MVQAATRARASGRQADRLYESVFGDGPGAADARELNLAKSAADLPLRATRAISAWQDHVMRLVQSAEHQKRSLTRSTPLDDDTLALVAVLAILGENAVGHHAAAACGRQRHPDPSPAHRDGRAGRASAVHDIFRTARAELNERARLLLDEELRRFSEVIDGAGPCDEVAGVRLYQAAFMLEALQ